MTFKVKPSRKTKRSSGKGSHEKEQGLWEYSKHTRYADMKVSSYDTALCIMNKCNRIIKAICDKQRTFLNKAFDFSL